MAGPSECLRLLCLCLWLVAPSLAGDAAPERVSYRGAQLLRVTAPADAPKEVVDDLIDIGDLQLWKGLEVDGETMDVMVRKDMASQVKELLTNQSVAYDIVIEDLQEAIDKENNLVTDSELDDLQNRAGHRMEWRSYHRLHDIHQYLDYLGQTLPNLCSVRTIGSSIGGWPLKMLHIKSDKPNSPAIWIDGGIHAREWISPASVTYIIDQLVDKRDSMPANSPALNVDWYILPVVNPDGYEHSHSSDRFWRKNRRSGNQRCSGVDLNRNFGYKWGGAGSSNRPCDEIYAGSHAFSEPETSAISSFVQGNSNIKGYISYHSYGQYILYPWGYAAYVPPDHGDLRRVGNKAAQAMQTAGGGSYRVGSSAITLYPASGGSDDWAKGAAGVKYSYTIELRDQGRHGFVLPAQYIVPTGKEAFAAASVIAGEVANLK